MYMCVHVCMKPGEELGQDAKKMKPNEKESEFMKGFLSEGSHGRSFIERDRKRMCLCVCVCAWPLGKWSV